MKRLILLALGLLLAGSAVAVAATPAAQLTNKLFTTSFRNSELPSGFNDPKVTLEDPDGKQIGKVAVEISGPDAGDLIIYSVFPSAAVAAQRLASPKLGSDATVKARVIGRVPGWGKQSKMVVGTVTGKNVFGQTVKNGITMLAVLRGPAIVQAASLSSSSETSGDIQSARKLLAAAIKHFDRVRG